MLGEEKGVDNSALRNEKKGAKRKKEKGPCLLQLWSFLFSTFSLRAARSGEKSINKTFPSSEPALIDHAESVFGEEGKRFARKAELERGV